METLSAMALEGQLNGTGPVWLNTFLFRSERVVPW